jgi:hypothetical protein
MHLRTLSFVAVAAALGLFPVAAQAGFYSGNLLYEVCSTEKTDKAFFEKSYECVGYIAGAVDAFNTTREGVGLKSCLPGGVTISKLREVTIDYMAKNPKDRAKSASSQVFAATRKAWPCPAGKGKTKSKRK